MKQFKINIAFPITNLCLMVNFDRLQESDKTNFLHVFGSLEDYFIAKSNFELLQNSYLLFNSSVELIIDENSFNLGLPKYVFDQARTLPFFFLKKENSTIMIRLSGADEERAAEIVKEIFSNPIIEFKTIWSKWFKDGAVDTEKVLGNETPIVVNGGLHTRASVDIIKHAVKFESEIFLLGNKYFANAKDIISVMTLATSKGEKINVFACGNDAKQAVEALSILLSLDSLGYI